MIFRASGKGAAALFQNESGGHRWQRVPPNEKRGRIHTSTVTVVVLPEEPVTDIELSTADLEWQATRGSGPGGQHRNKVDSCVILTHRPTGIIVRCDAERSQYRNRVLAYQLLRHRLRERESRLSAERRNAERRRQAGTGMRGDKIRTIRCQDGIVTCHRTGEKGSLKAYLRGHWLPAIGVDQVSRRAKSIR